MLAVINRGRNGQRIDRGNIHITGIKWWNAICSGIYRRDGWVEVCVLVVVSR